MFEPLSIKCRLPIEDYHIVLTAFILLHWAESCSEYQAVAKKGPEGDVPVPAGFADKSVFWKIVGISGLFGAIMGIFAVAVLNCSNEIPKLWVDNGNFDSYDDFKLYNGKTSWIIVTTCTGFLVGCVRFFTKYVYNVLFVMFFHYANISRTYAQISGRFGWFF